MFLILHASENHKTKCDRRLWAFAIDLVSWYHYAEASVMCLWMYRGWAGQVLKSEVWSIDPG